MVPFKTRSKRARSSKCSRIVCLKVNDLVDDINEPMESSKSYPTNGKEVTKMRFHQRQKKKHDFLSTLPYIETNEDTLSYQYIKNHPDITQPHIFINGSPSNLPLANFPHHNAIQWSADCHFCIFDSVNGGFRKDLCTLPSREFLLTTLGRRNDYSKPFEALKATIELTAPESKEKLDTVHRVVVFDDKNNTPLVVGKTVIQGGNGGIGNKFLPKGLPPKYVGFIASLLAQISHTVQRFLDTNSIVGIQALRKCLDCEKLRLTEDMAVTSFLPSLNANLNCYVSIHSDEDCAVGVVTCIASGLVTMDSEILIYFCFPTIGRCIGMRNGDTLIFNPRVKHCCSSRVNKSMDVILMAQYFKTGIAGRNNNEQDLSDIIKKEL